MLAQISAAVSAQVLSHPVVRSAPGEGRPAGRRSLAFSMPGCCCEQAPVEGCQPPVEGALVDMVLMEQRSSGIDANQVEARAWRLRQYASSAPLVGQRSWLSASRGGLPSSEGSVTQARLC